MDKIPHQRSIRCISFSKDGEFLASCGFDAQTNLYKRKHPDHDHSTFMYRYITSLEGHENEVKCVSWSIISESKYHLATCGRDKTIWIWEILLSHIDSKDSDEDIHVDCVAVLQEHTQDVKQVLWHPYISDLLFSASADDTIRLWKEASDEDEFNASPGEWFSYKTLTKHQSIVWSIDISKWDKGRWLVSVCENGSICIWDGSLDWQCVHIIQSSTILSRPLYTVSWSSVHRIFSTAGGDDSIYIYHWDSSSLRLLCKKDRAHDGDINHLLWINESLLASCGDDLYIRLWAVNLIKQ